jgi:MraZ protein
MLLGRYKGKITDKSRLAFPAKLRAELKETIVVTQGYEKSLIAVSERGWKSLIENTGNKPFVFGPARDTTRFLLGSAQTLKLDKQGRFVLPDYLLRYAQIDKEVIFLGLGSYVEIWNTNRWNAYQNKLENNIEDIADRLSSLNSSDK